jgi:hypothetical protein
VGRLLSGAAAFCASASSPKPRFLNESGAMRFLCNKEEVVYEQSERERRPVIDAAISGYGIRMLPRRCDGSMWGELVCSNGALICGGGTKCDAFWAHLTALAGAAFQMRM